MVELTVERHVLEANERQADQNRAVFDEAGLFVIKPDVQPRCG
jgi:hypothetical protein